VKWLGVRESKWWWGAVGSEVMGIRFLHTSRFSTSRQFPTLAGQSSETGKHTRLYTTRSWDRPAAGSRAATGDFHYCVLLPEDSWVTVMHMLLVDTITHSSFWPVISERSPSTALSVEYLNRTHILRFVVGREDEWFWVRYRIIIFS